MAGFGAGAFGSGAFGSGGDVTLTEAVQLTRNTLRVTFAGPVALENPGMITDGLYDRNYTLAAHNTPGAHVPRVVWATRETLSSVILSLDAELDGPGVVYRVIADPRLVSGGTVEARSALFHTFGEARTKYSRQVVKSFDVASAEPLDTDGDFRNDAGLDNLKKRILRRLTTRLGTFAHLGNYGLRTKIKGRITIGVLRDLQAQALAQVRAEPGVRDVRCVVSVVREGVVLLHVEVEARMQGAGALGSFEVDVELPIGA